MNDDARNAYGSAEEDPGARDDAGSSTPDAATGAEPTVQACAAYAGKPGADRATAADAALRRRLTDALGRGAERAAPPADAWGRFAARLQRAQTLQQADPRLLVTEDDRRRGRGRGDDPAVDRAGHRVVLRNGNSTGGHDRPAAASRRHVRWRAPLIAAAAVVAIAVAASAIVTDGFGTGGRHHPAATGGPRGEAVGITVSVAAPSEMYYPAAGSAVAGAGRGSTASKPGATSVVLSFTGGRPPAAALGGTFLFPGGMTAGAGPRHSDGTPLGYLAISGGLPEENARYLWGAVGPDIAQVQVTAPLPAGPGDIDPGFAGGAQWVIDSGKGTAWSSPEAATSVWTVLGDGWHGFAVQLPQGATSVTAIGLGSDGRGINARSFDLVNGSWSSSDLPPLSLTGTSEAARLPGDVVSSSMSTPAAGASGLMSPEPTGTAGPATAAATAPGPGTR